MTAARAEAGPLTLVGIPVIRWMFGLRVWTAMMLALYVAFWLELDGASSAGTCVGILALPTRGQASEKAFYRSIATVVGVTASIAITGLFSQARDLFVVAFAGWLGLCVYGAAFLDGNKAYCCVLSGYTVAIVSVFQLDSPQDVWSSGINRGAAIAVGIAAITLINDIFAAPDVLPKVLNGVGAARRKALDLGRAALSGRAVDDADALDVFKAVSALHPQVSAMETESSFGRYRAAAARSTIVAAVEEAVAARALARHLEDASPIDGAADDLGAASAAEALRRRCDAAGLRSSPARAALPFLIAGALAEADRLACAGLADLASDRRPEREPRLPLFRSRRLAARKGVRVAVAVALSAVPLVYSSWPQTYVVFAFLGILGALGSTTPNIQSFASGAMVALPIGMALAGLTEFVVLDGADAFPQLAIAMAPPIIGAGLLVSSPNPKLAGMGSLLLIFTPVFLSPANPQKYDPLSFLVQCLLVMTAVAMLKIWLAIIPPAGDALRRRWLIRSAGDDLRAAAAGRGRRLTPGEAAYRAADRIGQVAALGSAGDPARGAALADAFALAETEGALRRARARLADLRARPDGSAPARAGLAALSALDREALRRAAPELEAQPAGLRAAAAMLHLVDLLDAHRAALDRLVPGLVRT
ncbi:FUSC family protein [Lichenibacterium dinghuense]|uniref:FUSC family protein n=1 Tax=Lichenibacterium dinghuense TaxID=2895977 RepID=UPI001F328952|nr:FUSC family protein [Lichenibacterium sp. 6Y81]